MLFVDDHVLPMIVLGFGRSKIELGCRSVHVFAFQQDWIEQGLTSPPTQYRLSGRQFYRSKDPTNSIKVLKEKLEQLVFVGGGVLDVVSTVRVLCRYSSTCCYFNAFFTLQHIHASREF